MNSILANKENQFLTEALNVKHKSKMSQMLNELLEKYNERIITHSLCINCGHSANDTFTRYIYWRKYTFCGGWCQYDGECDIRKHYSLQRLINHY